MKFKSSITFFLFILFSITTFSQSTYFVKYKNKVPRSLISQKIVNQKLNENILKKLTNIPKYKLNQFARGLFRENEKFGRIIKVDFDSTIDESTAASILQSDSDVEYVQRANIYKLDFIPNDSLLSEQWGLNKINAFDAWNVTQGSDSVLLGIIDTGIDYNHPDLKNKIYLNHGEIGIDNLGRDKRTNGIDDDEDGFIDDYRGWDFTDRVGFPFDSTGGDYLGWDNDPFDDQGHGTYIAGIASAQTNNQIGIAGVAPKLKILNLRAFDPSGYGEEDDVAAAILYAVNMGCKVINMSFGDDAFSYVLRDVIQFAYSQNIVLVASAGNSGSDAPHYPSGYSEVICVGNSTEQDYVAGSSNYGSTLDLVAPGSSILTTAKNDSYSFISGTSASAPFVSGAAALILSLGNFKNEEVKQIIKSTADDIGETGWDIRSGSGRLNLFKAVTVVAPSIIKFINPTQDFATSQKYLSVKATILSPYFVSYNLYVGKGYNPTNWTTLISNGNYQISDKEIYNLDLTNFSDSVYTLRLVINQSTGNDLEERVNFYVDRTPPIADLISLIPAFYGDKTTILASVHTNEPSVVRMYYRTAGQPDFKFVTLDGFTINNQFVKTLHYGFIPKDLVELNSNYEVYFVAENLVGLISQITNSGNYFNISTNYNAEYSKENVMPYSLPPGSIFDRPVDISPKDFTNVILRPDSNPNVSRIYKLDNQSFNKIDSLNNRIIKDFGDFNNNGLLDLLTYLVRDGYIDEQLNNGSPSFQEKYSNTGGKFWPILASDINSTGITNVLSVSSDTTFDVWEVQSNLNLNKVISLDNFTPKGLGDNVINSPNAVIADADGNGQKELWMVDTDGDIFSYLINGNNSFVKQYDFRTGFVGSSAYITKGDYDGDGKDDIAVILHSVDAIDISPFYRVIIFNINNSAFNVIFDYAFLDAATEFNNNFRKAENGIKLADIDNDGKDELILFVFPYAYIFRNDQEEDKIISYKENINSNSIFVGDLNKNSVPDIAFPYSDKIIFSEFESSKSASTPYEFEGYSINKDTVYLKWLGTGQKYFIYKGTSQNNLQMIDSTSNNFYSDVDVVNNTYYYYGVKSFDASKQEPVSQLSKIIEVYSHQPALPLSADSKSSKDILIKFSDKIKNTIDNLQSFEVLQAQGNRFSISANDQFSYLLSFSTPLPSSLAYSVVIKNLRDYYNSPIKTDTLFFTVSSNNTPDEFYIVSSEIINAYKIKITFNLNIDRSSAENTLNYSFKPENKVSSVQVDDADPKTIYLDLTNQKPIGSIGKEYVLSLKNIVSDFASGNIPINSGAGSYVVLSTYAKNLADIYVYPNPVRDIKNDSKITFANLPKLVKISIWTIDGNFVNEIEEKDGNGGADFNLRDLNGNLLSSGIYFYRAVQLDDQNNEGEEKLGKFAIIK